MAKQTSAQDLRALNLSSRELTTNMQLSSLLNVAGAMATFMSGSPAQMGVESKALHGESPIAAENCFIATCEAIQSIVADKQRWGFEFQKKLEEDYAQAMQLNLEFMRAQRDAAVEAASPHHICNPNLARLQDGTYAAFTGSAEEPNVYGLGASPEAALAAFDDAFKNKVAQTIQELNEQNEQNEQVDENGNNSTGSAPKPGPDNRGDSKADGPGQESGGAGGGPV